MGRNFSPQITLTTLVLLISVISPPSVAQTTERSMLTILMFNYSSAPAEVLSKAAAETSHIFTPSGIDLAWTYCPPRPSPNSARACESEPVPDQIRVRVLGRHLTGIFQDSVFGFATAPTFATVYYDSAQLLVNTASDRESYLPVVLGGVMAHEIGHLLLGENQHTVIGIMQARWDICQIQQLLKGALQFTPQQAIRIRRNSRIRTTRGAAY